MRYVLAVLVMCLCLAGCQVAESHREASFDYSDYIGYSLRSDVPEVRWPSMFDFGPRETSLSFSLAWDLARSNAWDSETKPGSYLDYDVDLDIGEFTPLDYDLFEELPKGESLPGESTPLYRLLGPDFE